MDRELDESYALLAEDVSQEDLELSVTLIKKWKSEVNSRGVSEDNLWIDKFQMGVSIVVELLGHTPDVGTLNKETSQVIKALLVASQHLLREDNASKN